ncbi:MAG: hypothetical protein ACRC6B_00835 [Fusobacteriaceae bacterium]
MTNNEKLAKIGNLVTFDTKEQKHINGQIVGYHELEDWFIVKMFNNEKLKGWNYRKTVKESHHVYSKTAKNMEDCYYVKTGKCIFI